MVAKRTKLLQKLQQELEHRTKIEKVVIRLIGNCEFDKANKLLNSLDDKTVRKIEMELEQAKACSQERSDT